MSRPASPRASGSTTQHQRAVPAGDPRRCHRALRPPPRHGRMPATMRLDGHAPSHPDTGARRCPRCARIPAVSAAAARPPPPHASRCRSPSARAPRHVTRARPPAPPRSTAPHTTPHRHRACDAPAASRRKSRAAPARAGPPWQRVAATSTCQASATCLASVPVRSPARASPVWLPRIASDRPLRARTPIPPPASRSSPRVAQFSRRCFRT